MKKIKLVNYDDFIVVSDIVYDRVIRHNWHLNWKPNTQFSSASVYTTINGKTVTLSRFILNENDSKILIDHKDRNPLNNLEDNLRKCSKAENVQNSSKLKNTSSKFKGVVWEPRRKWWIARIKTKGRTHYLGSFSSEIEAAKAYDANAKTFFKEFALLNFPDQNI